jgi:hypothetical protein
VSKKKKTVATVHKCVPTQWFFAKGIRVCDGNISLSSSLVVAAAAPPSEQLFLHPASHSANKQTFLVGNIAAIVRMTGFLSLSLQYHFSRQRQIFDIALSFLSFYERNSPPAAANMPGRAYFERKYARHLF